MEVEVESDGESDEGEVHDKKHDGGDRKITFRHYVGVVVKTLRQEDPNYDGFNISTSIRQYLSNLLVEFIQRISSLVYLTSTCMKNKTISDVVILRTVEAILIDGHVAHEEITFENKLKPKKKSEDVDEHELVAVRKFKYPTSGFHELEETVKEKLEIYKAIKNKAT